ncbi:MAG: prepilin-type N-terminal cleavage/methylation domain-containing protein [bacterium]|nr:prepilin-type N-terminal cleavage/methylation domain-containing protein [bacterium]
MNFYSNKKGFTLIEVMVASAVFLLFALGVYGGISLVFKIVYQSRLRILETALLSEELEVVRNLPYDSIGIVNGNPVGVLPHTKTVERNGVEFDLVATVRSIDDSFDGTVGGTPNDTAPADYKLVEISAICASCSQLNPVILSTRVSPRNLEGASANGALFVQVFDAGGQGVSGANIHIVNTAQTPNLIIDDTTDNTGWLKIVDTPTGTQSYHITVSKSGYSSDYTVVPSVENPNPVKGPSNVVTQTVTEISFAIDRVGAINFHSLNNTCDSIGGVGLNLHGTKVLGLNPDIYKFTQNFSTDGSGNYSLTNVEWDKYFLTLTGVTYDIAGTIPMLPLNMTAGLNQEVYAILRLHTSNSVLINIIDAGTKLPLSDAVVHFTGTGVDQTLTTDLGYVRQTDWSGGSGQTNFINEDQYFSDDGSVVVGGPAGDVKLRKSGGNYIGSGWLESSTFDFGSSVNLRNIIWEPIIQPVQSGTNPITFQLAGSASSSPAVWDYTGADGTSSTVYTATSTVVHESISTKRYLRYRVLMNTADTNYTPLLSEFAFTYTNSCTPPGQVFFRGISAGTYDVEITRTGYTPYVGQIVVDGNNDTMINMSVVE